MKAAVSTRPMMSSLKGLADFLKRSCGIDRGDIVCRLQARKLKSGAQRATITVGDRGFWAQAIYDAQVEEPGDVLVFISHLFGLSTKAQKTIMTVDSDKELRFKSGNVIGRVHLTKKGEVADRPEVPLTSTAPCATLLELLEAVYVKPYLASAKQLYGVVRLAPGRLSVMSTDNFLVSVAAAKAECAVGDVTDSVIDVGLMLDFIKALWPKDVRADDHQVEVGATATTFRMRGPTFDICLPKLSVNLPDLEAYVEKLRATEAATSFSVDLDELADAVKAVSGIAAAAIKSSDAAITIDLSKLEEGHLTCRAASTAGDTAATVKVKAGGAPQQQSVLVSGRQLGDALAKLHQSAPSAATKKSKQGPAAAAKVAVTVLQAQMLVAAHGKRYALPLSLQD